MARVRLRYYWPGYQKDVEEWCKTCMTCQQRNNPASKNIAPLMSIDTGQGPFEQIALDILKLPRTSRGNQYLLVIEDYFSKWVEAFPMRRTVEPGVAQCLLLVVRGLHWWFCCIFPEAFKDLFELLVFERGSWHAYPIPGYCSI